MRNVSFRFVLIFGLFFCSFVAFSTEKENDKEQKLNLGEFIFSHIGDSHEYHLWDWKGHPVSIALPVILYTEQGLVTFLSSEFKHDNSGEVVVEKNGQKFVKFKENIFYADEQGRKLDTRPLNFSITKNVVVLFLVSAIMIFLFTSVASSYKGIGEGKAPTKIGTLVEFVVVFIRDSIAIPNIGEKKYKKYMPFLLTVFFLILFGNILGLVPVVSASLTNDIFFTGTMAVITFLITTFSANSNYWKHIFATPGLPVWLLPIMIPVEILSMFTKPFSLMVRLFANMTAGHIIILSLISLMFALGTSLIFPVSVGFALFINLLELLVALIQAYVFTVLSALFIGGAVAEEHH